MKVEISRRDFIEFSTLSGGGIAVACLVGSWESDAVPDMDAPAAFQPNAWLKIFPDNRMVFLMDRAEMGQGVYSSLATIIAEELDVPPPMLTVELAPPGAEFGNPEMSGIQVTGGSTSVKVGFQPLRRAGAAARLSLMQSAARTWAVPVQECQTTEGKVVHPQSRRQMSYGEAANQAKPVDAADIKLRSPEQFKWIGKSAERLDNRAKTTGTAVFGIDVKVPNALNCLIVRPRDLKGEVISFDDSEARRIQGFVKALKISSGVAVVCQKYWQCKLAAQKVKVEWKQGPMAGLNSIQLAERYRKLLAEDATKTHVDEGDFKQAFDKAEVKVEAIYEVPFAAHATMEPQNCTAHVTDDSAEVWAPTQGVGMALEMVERVTGLSRSKIKVYSTFLGGGFGRRVAQDYVAEAVTVSQQLKLPVKLIWSREDDMQHSILRPLTVHKLRAGLDGSGRIVAWSHRVVGQCVISQALPDLIPAAMPAWMPRWSVSGLASIAGFATRNFGAGAVAVEGGTDNLYQVPNILVDFVHDEPGVPVGFWRSVGSSHNGFVVESFVDELAHASHADPVEFRRKHLAPDSPYRRVLDLAVAKAGAAPTSSSGKFRGVALHKSFGSYVAEVCDASISSEGIRAHQVVCAIECGQVINPDTVRAQVSGGVIFGLSQTIGGKISIDNGGVVESNFHNNPIVRMNQCPHMEVHIVPSSAEPTGVGEPGVPPIAAALANAVFQGTGQRLRKLPLELEPT